LRNFSS